MSNSAQESRDRSLIERCLQGDESAWSHLYRHYHAGLVRYAGALFGKRDRTGERAETVVQQFWSSLCLQQFRPLRRFNARRGRLATYLMLLLLHEFTDYERARQRRPATTDPESLRHVPDRAADDWALGLVLDDFRAALTAAERECLDALIGRDRIGVLRPHADAWERKRKQRVLRKLHRFIA